MSVTVDQVIERYIALRDEKTALEDKQALEVDVIKNKMAKIESWLLAMANRDGVQSFKTSHGTAFKKENVSVTVENKTSFLKSCFGPFVRWMLTDPEACKYAEEDLVDILISQYISLMDIRACKTQCEEYATVNQAYPAGIKASKFVTIQVRRS